MSFKFTCKSFIKSLLKPSWKNAFILLLFKILIYDIPEYYLTKTEYNEVLSWRKTEEAKFYLPILRSSNLKKVEKENYLAEKLGTTENLTYSLITLLDTPVDEYDFSFKVPPVIAIEYLCRNGFLVQEKDIKKRIIILKTSSYRVEIDVINNRIFSGKLLLTRDKWGTIFKMGLIKKSKRNPDYSYADTFVILEKKSPLSNIKLPPEPIPTTAW
jgi:hypothetical protein